MSKYESTFDNNAVRVRLEDTEHGVALSLEMLHEGLDEPSAGTTLYIGQEQIDGMVKWLQAKASRPEEQALLHAVLNQARETLLVGIRGSNKDLMHSLGKLSLACKAHWDWQTRLHMNIG